MDELAKSDIFFVVTTFAVIIVTIVIVVAAVYVVKILKTVKYISDRAKQETDMMAEDIADLRSELKKGVHLAALGGFIKRLINRRKVKK
jgi:hypothetical protein